MVEAKLRVESTEARNGSKNPFYGDTMVKKVVEDILYHDTDKRDDIAPCGVYATICIPSQVILGEGDEPLKTIRVLGIKINSHYFDNDGFGNYTAFFTIEDRTYEIWVCFEDGRINDLTLSEWLNDTSFEDGYAADKVYHKNEFTTIEEFIC